MPDVFTDDAQADEGVAPLLDRVAAAYRLIPGVLRLLREHDGRLAVALRLGVREALCCVLLAGGVEGVDGLLGVHFFSPIKAAPRTCAAQQEQGGWRCTQEQRFTQEQLRAAMSAAKTTAIDDTKHTRLTRVRV